VQSQSIQIEDKIYDAIIIGGGPAGISCALELSYCDIECMVICREERLGGQLWDIRGELLNLACGYFESAGMLAQQMEKLTKRTNIQIVRNKTVDKIDARNKLVFCGEETFKAKTILVSTGLRLKQLELHNSTNLQQDILYRDDTNVSAYANLRVAVIGGGDNALMKAIELAEIAQKVYLINRTNKWRARSAFVGAAKENERIEILENTELKDLTGESTLRGAILVSRSASENAAERINESGAAASTERTILIDKIFVKIGYVPNTEPFKGQVAMNESGYLLVDQKRRTGAPGIYAAGDILSDTCPRIATACGDGSLAAESIQIYLGKRLTP
jgi:thioredoxin reductase (NADPH)